MKRNRKDKSAKKEEAKYHKVETEETEALEQAPESEFGAELESEVTGSRRNRKCRTQ